MAVARSIFTLDGGFQLFCAAFDMPMTGVSLKVSLGYKKMFFGHSKKIIFPNPMTTFKGTTVMQASKSEERNIETPNPI